MLWVKGPQTPCVQRPRPTSQWGALTAPPTPATMATELRGGGEWLRCYEMRGVVSSEEPGDET